MSAVLASGGRVGVVRAAEEMLGLLDAWGIPRARRLVLRAGVASWHVLDISPPRHAAERSLRS
jgi:hypothetical protein